MVKIFVHALAFVALTIITQIGGVAWLIALGFRYRVFTFIAAYAVLSAATIYTAPIFGRVPLPCWSNGPLQSQSMLYCALNRHYVTPELKDVANDVAQKMDVAFPGTKTLTLDGGFPYFSYFPLLPHLSHHDGEKLDFAFYYQNSKGVYLKGKTLSPIGYFGFPQGSTNCTQNRLTLRWDFNWLQPLLPDYRLDEERTAGLMKILAADARINKLLLEPHLKTRFNITSAKVRFQGCRAARHDDHVHAQL